MRLVLVTALAACTLTGCASSSTTLPPAQAPATSPVLPKDAAAAAYDELASLDADLDAIDGALAELDDTTGATQP